MKRKFERWRGIKGFVGYAVSDLGRVYSSKSGRIIKLLPVGNTPYKQISIWKDGKQYKRYIHRLVLEAFVGPCPEGLECLHGPGGSEDNSLSNLSWGTHRKNQGPDRIRDGTHERGERNSNSKLTEKDVLEIYKSKESSSVIGGRFGIDPAHARQIRRGNKWGWLTRDAS